MKRNTTLGMVAGLLFAISVRAADPPKKPGGDSKADEPKERLVETKHVITIGGVSTAYRATAGTLVLKGDDGKPTASVFFVAYNQIGDDRTRPITFAFNGGPGSSSVWLHMGAFGPRRVVVSENGERLAPPFRLVDNESSLLDLTDLVFVDPVSTGFSRPAPGQKAQQFHGVEEDIRSVGEFIRLYTVRFNRWDSPKFLAGESYGTTRASGLVGHMQDQLGMNFNGVILVSAVLNFQTLRFDLGNDLPYVVYLPTYAATAWYHKKLDAGLLADRSALLRDVEAFARGEYASALMKGSRLSASERKAVAAKVARFTGLSEDYVRRANLRVEISRFTKELLRGERRTVGRYDSRFMGADLDAVGERPEYDPSYAAVQGPYTALFNDYLRNELKYESDVPYEILTGKVRPWDFGSARNRYLNVSEPLRQAMTKNRDLRVYVANGYYDLATPFFATQYTFDHLGLDAALASHVSMGYYEAGHMMYLNPASRTKLKEELSRFYGSARRK